MKKRLALALAASFVFGVAGTAFAAANPFVDVPAKHWAYDSVAKLAKAGVVDGYGDGTFRGDKTMSRYEMAQIVAKAMAKSEKADAETKALVDKLAVEFASELNNLGVRVAKLEKNASKIKFEGETHLWYENFDDSKSKVHGGDAFTWRERLHLSADVTDKISYTARIEAKGTFNNTNTNTTANFTRNFITVKELLGADSVMIGRIPLAVGRAGLGFGDTDKNDGVRVDHKFGKAAVTGIFASEAANTDVAGLNIDWNANKDTIVNAGYYEADKAGNYATEKLNFVNVGFAYDFHKGFSMVGDYFQSDAAGDPDGYAAQLVYNWKSGKKQTQFYGWQKMVNANVAHDQGASVMYINTDKASTPGYGTGNTKGFGSVLDATDNVKGYVVGYQNMVNKNVLFELTYADLESKSSSAQDKRYYGAFEFYY